MTETRTTRRRKTNFVLTCIVYRIANQNKHEIVYKCLFYSLAAFVNIRGVNVFNNVRMVNI